MVNALALGVRDRRFESCHSDVHISTQQVLRFFHTEHLAEGDGKATAVIFEDTAHYLAGKLPEDLETTVALRKLLEAKDAAVRAALVGEGVITNYEPQNDR